MRRFLLCFPWLKDLPLYSVRVRGTLQYLAAPLLMPARGSSCWWLLDRVWRALTTPPISICMIYHRSSLSYTRVMGSVSIHNLCTVATRYGELLALLVYLTWYSTGASPRQSRWPAKWTHLHRCFVCCCPGGRRGDTEQVLARWQHLVAFMKAMDLHHWAMCVVFYHRTAMAIKNDGGTFVCCCRLFRLIKA